MDYSGFYGQKGLSVGLLRAGLNTSTVIQLLSILLTPDCYTQLRNLSQQIALHSKVPAVLSVSQFVCLSVCLSVVCCRG